MIDQRPAAHPGTDTARPSGSGGRTALPAPLTSLVGRDGDLLRIEKLLDTGNARLVTLTGPGGVGKTRLAIAAGHRLAPDFVHGVHFIDLSRLQDPTRVPALMARSLGFVQREAADPVALLCDALQDRHAMLIIDNFEHLL